MKKDVGMTPCQKLLKQEGTARWIESMQQSSATPKNRDVGRGLRKIVACSQSTSQCLLVSTVFGTVSSLHPSSFLHLYTKGLWPLCDKCSACKELLNQQHVAWFKRSIFAQRGLFSRWVIVLKRWSVARCRFVYMRNTSMQEILVCN